MQQSEAADKDCLLIKETVSKTKAAHFFMSANTPSGYISKFSDLYDAKKNWKAYILKSVPGIAPLLLPKMGEQFEKAGMNVEYIHCVQSPEDISALVLTDQKLCIIDGVPPHSIESSFPGVVEKEIMLCEHDNEKLYEMRSQILQFSARSQTLYNRVYSFIGAAASLQKDVFKIVSESVDIDGITKYVNGLSKRLFIQKSGTGTVYNRYLSGITANGITSFYEQNSKTYNRIYAIEDDYGVGCILLKELEKKAVKQGYDVYLCSCSILGEPQALFIPSLSLAFVTSNNHHRASGKACRHINIKRFTDYDTLRLKKARIGFNKRASKELYDQAIILLGEAKANDNMIKDCYKSSIDIEKAKEKLDKLTAEIISNVSTNII